MVLSSQSHNVSRKQAIVIGGGIAGLLAARVLLNHFEQVTIIERDYYPQEPVFRPGTPQARHVHNMLMRGQHILEDLFPGFKQKIIAHGAIEEDLMADNLYYYGYGRIPSFPSRLKGFMCSRLLIEWQIRQELLKYEHLKILEGHEVVGLVGQKENQITTGVQLRKRLRTQSGEHSSSKISEIQTLSADLIVDASGRDSRTKKWLTDLGYEPPKETVINAFLGYSSRAYFISDEGYFYKQWRGAAIQAAPQQKMRGGAVWYSEGNRWVVVLAGAGKDYPPTDEEGYMEFAKSLPDPTIYEAIKDARPLSPIYGYRRTENIQRHYECLKDQPDGFIAIGDAVSSFNPVYGQGMTAAAMGALTLDECLRAYTEKSLRGFSKRFQSKLAKAIEPIWQLATASDYRLPVTEGPKLNAAKKLLFGYIEKIIALLVVDQQVREIFAEVLHLMRPARDLFHPTIVWKVLTKK